MMQELAIFHDDEALATTEDVARYALGQDRISTILVASLDSVLCGFSATYDRMNFIHGFRFGTWTCFSYVKTLGDTV
jgi:hypothetical protein